MSARAWPKRPGRPIDYLGSDPGGWTVRPDPCAVCDGPVLTHRNAAHGTPCRCGDVDRRRAGDPTLFDLLDDLLRWHVARGELLAAAMTTIMARYRGSEI